MNRHFIDNGDMLKSKVKILYVYTSTEVKKRLILEGLAGLSHLIFVYVNHGHFTPKVFD